MSSKKARAQQAGERAARAAVNDREELAQAIIKLVPYGQSCTDILLCVAGNCKPLGRVCGTSVAVDNASAAQS